MDNIVLDTNCLIMALSSRNEYNQIWKSFLKGEYVLCVSNEIPVTTECALLLEAALGTNASIWIGLQADYNLQKAKQDKSFMNRLEQIRKIAAVL